MSAVNASSNQKYLVETDKRFADYQNYTSSDYLLSRLAVDPLTSQKRLGDGFYEQKLINDQITQLTGRRYLENNKYTSTDAQVQALMDAALSESKNYLR